jgi:6-phosphogluconolactonase
MTTTVLRGHHDADAVAKAAAKDLAHRLEQLLEQKPTVHLVITGGTVGIKTLEQLAPLIAERDLSRLQIWWGDERFVQRENADRNFIQAREALLSKVSIPHVNLHEMPSPEDGNLLDACREFADSVAVAAPEFDVVLLGMGADGHIASLFPNSNADEVGSWIVSESNSPKPPTERISFSFRALNSADEVWFLVSGADKAAAVAKVFSGEKLPAALVSGTTLTKWYLDRAAASGITS